MTLLFESPSSLQNCRHLYFCQIPLFCQCFKHHPAKNPYMCCCVKFIFSIVFWLKEFFCLTILNSPIFSDQSRRLLSNHDASSVCVPRHQVWHDWAVRHPEIAQGWYLKYISQRWAILLSWIVFGDDEEYASRRYNKPEPIHPVDPEPGVYNSLAEILIVAVFFVSSI